MQITVKIHQPILRVEPRMVGINTNFLTDHDAARSAGQGYEQALRDMGVASLRYPGGEKSDEYFWSTPPWDAPRPTLAVTGESGRLSPMQDYVENYSTFRHKPLDFDEFVALCKALSADPVICVNFDSMAMKPRPGRSEPPAKDVLLKHAVEWVRYSNQICGYCVRYWELGNESYHANSLGTMRAEDYARCFVEFARAMKEVDPDILIGANGHVSKDARSKADEPDGPIWWKTLLEIAGDEIDYLAVHPYPCWKWGSYDYFIDHQPRFTDAVDEALAAVAEWAPQHSGRIRVLVTETNSADWTASNLFPDLTGWPLENDLGHALVLFDIIGQHLLHPQVDGLQVWNTRWVNPVAKELWNTLDENNGCNATGYALAIWGQNLLQEMVAVESSPAVRAYASYAPASRNLNVFLLNKTRERQPVDLLLPGFVENWAGDWLALTGTHSEDQAPVYQKITDLSGSGPQIDLRLPELSISIIRLHPG